MFNSSPCTWKHLKCLKFSSPRPPPNTKTEVQNLDYPKISIWQLQISHIHRITIKRGRTLAVVVLAHRRQNGWGVLDSWSICNLSQLTSTLGQRHPNHFNSLVSRELCQISYLQLCLEYQQHFQGQLPLMFRDIYFLPFQRLLFCCPNPHVAVFCSL